MDKLRTASIAALSGIAGFALGWVTRPLVESRAAALTFHELVTHSPVRFTRYWCPRPTRPGFTSPSMACRAAYSDLSLLVSLLTCTADLGRVPRPPSSGVLPHHPARPESLLPTIIKYSAGLSSATLWSVTSTKSSGRDFDSEGPMEARHLLENSSYGPTKLHVIFEAFDQAWAEIASNFGEAVDVERGRMRLAHAILAVANENEDAVGLKNAALEQIALDRGTR